MLKMMGPNSDPWGNDMGEDISSRVMIVPMMFMSLDSKFDVIRLNAISVDFCGK